MLPGVTFAEASIDTASITVPSVVTQTPPLAVTSTPDVILTAFSTGDRLEVAELFNQSSVAVDMGAVTITTIDSVGGQREISLPSGWLLSRHYITFAYDTTLIRGAVPFDIPNGDARKHLNTCRIETANHHPVNKHSAHGGE